MLRVKASVQDRIPPGHARIIIFIQRVFIIDFFRNFTPQIPEYIGGSEPIQGFSNLTGSLGGTPNRENKTPVCARCTGLVDDFIDAGIRSRSIRYD